MKKIAVIPARGGSKRIPNKNIRLFCGRPMMAWSIEAAKNCGLFDRIIVSTDSEEIAKTASECDAEVPFMRPKKLSDDYTGTNAVAKHCLEWLLSQGEHIDYACCIYATAPFLQTEYLKKGFELLKESGSAFTFSATSFSFPIQRAIRIKPDGHVEPMFPEHIKKRSQDLEETYHDAGQFYWGHAASFLKDIPLFSSNSRPVIIPRYLVQDIDTLEDWEKAELMFKTWQAEKIEM